MCMKKRIDITINTELLEKFKEYCKHHNIKMSNVIENLIAERLHLHFQGLHPEHKKHIHEYTG